MKGHGKGRGKGETPSICLPQPGRDRIFELLPDYKASSSHNQKLDRKDLPVSKLLGHGHTMQEWFLRGTSHAGLWAASGTVS